MDPIDVDALALRARGGDRQALAALHAAVQPVIGPVLRRYAWRGPEGPLEPADLAQQAYLILAEVVVAWQGRGPFVAWLRRLFPLALLGYRRSVLRWDGPAVQTLPPDELSLLLETQPGLPTAPDPFETVFCRQLLALLPPAYRRLLCWRFVDGLSYRDVERLHGVPATTAQNQCERALAYLRARAEGREVAPLAPARPAAARSEGDCAASVERIWQLAAREGGLLPKAAVALAATGLGRRAYDNLIARLRATGCLRRAEGVTFCSRRGRRWQAAVPAEEAVRRLSLREAVPTAGLGVL